MKTSKTDHMRISIKCILIIMLPVFVIVLAQCGPNASDKMIHAAPWGHQFNECCVTHRDCHHDCVFTPSRCDRDLKTCLNDVCRVDPLHVVNGPLSRSLCITEVGVYYTYVQSYKKANPACPFNIKFNEQQINSSLSQSSGCIDDEIIDTFRNFVTSFNITDQQEINGTFYIAFDPDLFSLLM